MEFKRNPHGLRFFYADFVCAVPLDFPTILPLDLVDMMQMAGFGRVSAIRLDDLKISSNLV
jgi:hypothetical protein